MEPQPPFKNVGLPQPLADEVDRFMREHPEFGIKFRSDFTARAVEVYLDIMRDKVYKAAVIEALQGDRAPAAVLLEHARASAARRDARAEAASN